MIRMDYIVYKNAKQLNPETEKINAGSPNLHINLHTVQKVLEAVGV